MIAAVVIALCVLGLFPVLAALSGLLAEPGVAWDVLLAGRTWRLLGATVALGLATAFASALLGVPVAWIAARRRDLLVTCVAALLPLPLVLPPWIAGISWSRMLDLNGFWGAVFLLTASLWPLVALLGLRGFRQARGPVEAARLMRGGRRAFLSVELPLASPSILSGMLLVFVFAITDFSVVDFLSFRNPEPFVVLSNEIFQKWSRLESAAQAAAVSLPAIAPAVLALALVLRIERRNAGSWRGTGGTSAPGELGAGARAGAYVGGQAPAPRGTRGRNSSEWLTSLGLLVVLALVLAPVVQLGSWAVGYADAWSTLAEARDGAVRSVLVGLGCGSVMALLGVATAKLSLRLGPRASWALLALALLPLATPGVMLAVGEIRLWNHPANPLADLAYGSSWLLVLATAGRFMALGVLASRALLARRHPGPADAARLTGRSWIARSLRVELPALMPAVGLSLALGYLLAMRELDAVVVLPAGTGTLAHRIFGLVHIASDEMTATLCLGLVALVVIPGLAARLLGVPGVDCGPSRGPT